LNYKQTARNDISFLGLQFFIVRLHKDISLEVIKLGTTEMYQPFLTTHAYKMVVKGKQEKDTGTVKINKMDAEFKDKRAKIEAIKENISKKGCFMQTTVQHISNVPMRAMAPATATAATVTTSKTAMAAINSLDLDSALHANQIQLSVRHAITVSRKITSKANVTRGNVMKPHWSRSKS
jgi:hypothetical protein